MKIPKGWWKVEAGHYRRRQSGTGASLASVEYMGQLRSPLRRDGWHAFDSRVRGSSVLVGVYPTLRKAFEALGVKV